MPKRPPPTGVEGLPPRLALPIATPDGAGRPRIEADCFVAEDGARLPLRRWLPDGKPAAVVLGLHGFNDYSAGFAGVGTRLAQLGIATYAYDQRGFGAASRPGSWAGASRMAADAAAAAALLHLRHPGLPLYLTGESMGGAVALVTARRGGPGHAAVDGLILIAPAIWGQQTMGFFERAALCLGRLIPAFQWPAHSLPIRFLPSDNAAMLEALLADPLVIKKTRSDTLIGLVDLMGEAFQAAPELDLPALILYGEHDQIIRRGPMARFIAKLPALPRADQRLAFYPRGWHMLTRDLGGPAVIEDIATWIADPARPLPSGADREARARLRRAGAA